MALLIFLPARAAAEKVATLRPLGIVSDYAGVVDLAAKDQLEALTLEVNSKAQAQIIEVTIHSLEGVTIEEFASELFKKWGIGKKGQNRGVLILVAVDEHQYRVEVGYGLEAILPDGKVGSFGREAVPLLRQGDYDGALLHLARQIAGVIAQDRGVTLDALNPQGAAPSTPAPQAKKESEEPSTKEVLIFFAFLLVVLVAAMIHAFGPWSRRPIARGTRAGAGKSQAWGGGGFGGGETSGGFGGAASAVVEGLGLAINVASLFAGGESGGGGASGSW